MVVLLMAEILHQLISSLSIICRCCRISSINSRKHDSWVVWQKILNCNSRVCSLSNIQKTPNSNSDNQIRLVYRFTLWHLHTNMRNQLLQDFRITIPCPNAKQNPSFCSETLSSHHVLHGTLVNPFSVFWYSCTKSSWEVLTYASLSYLISLQCLNHLNWLARFCPSTVF